MDVEAKIFQNEIFLQHCMRTKTEKRKKEFKTCMREAKQVFIRVQQKCSTKKMHFLQDYFTRKRDCVKLWKERRVKYVDQYFEIHSSLVTYHLNNSPYFALLHTLFFSYSPFYLFFRNFDGYF
jgi:hypothetical protein